MSEEEKDVGVPKTPDYKDDLYIDVDQLDIEWLDQPLLFMKYAELLARAERRLGILEQKIKTKKAQLVLEVNNDPDIMGVGVKPTAPNVEAYYRNHEDHIALKDKFNEATYQKNMILNIVQAFNQRKMALENAVKLHGQSYFAGPSVPRELNQESMSKIKRRSVVEKMKRAKGKEA